MIWLIKIRLFQWIKSINYLYLLFTICVTICLFIFLFLFNQSRLNNWKWFDFDYSQFIKFSIIRASLPLIIFLLIAISNLLFFNLSLSETNQGLLFRTNSFNQNYSRKAINRGNSSNFPPSQIDRSAVNKPREKPSQPTEQWTQIRSQ